MKRFAASVLSLGLLGAGSRSAWSQHAGHGGMGMPAATAESKEEAELRKRGRLERLQEKIDALDELLGDPKLPAKKRAKLDAKLRKLLKEKDRLLGTDKVEVYVCPMGNFEGPMTTDGKCPKCGMALRRKEKSEAPR